MRGLLVERLRPFALVAFGAGSILNLTLVIAALVVLQWLDRAWILSVIVRSLLCSCIRQPVCAALRSHPLRGRSTTT